MDLRDHATDLEAAAALVLARLRQPRAIRLADRIDIGNTLWQLRQDAHLGPTALAARLQMSVSGLHKRECDGRMPAAALIQHARALGYDLALIPREQA
jgi:hypothetical protein